MKQKFNLKVFDGAAEICATQYRHYACVALTKASRSLKDTIERELFESLFLTSYTTFDVMHNERFGYVATDNEIQDIRVLAVCFAREIARLNNNRKASGFSPKELKVLHDTYKANF